MSPRPKKLTRFDSDSDAASAYTLHSVHIPESDSEELTASIVHPLLSPSALPDSAIPVTYGTLPSSHPPPSYFTLQRRRPLLTAAIKCAAIFVLSCLLLGGTLWVALPRVEEEDRPALHIPRSFAQLQELNTLLKKYRDIHPFRIVICYVVVYLFLQAFSLPGSMYMSILGGAVWGMPRAILLACTCVATGASLCYLLSAAFGPALLTLPKWRERLDRWSDRVESQRSNILSFMIILRIAPLPPHWVVNVLCPHLRIGLVPFWISTFFGIMGVTIIHTAIGGGLDQMTSADDFHLISWRNFAILASIAFAVLVPVGLRYVLTKNTAGGATSIVPPPSPALSARSGGQDPDRLSLASDEFAIPAPLPGTSPKRSNKNFFGRPPAEADGGFETYKDDPPNWQSGTVFTIEADEDQDPESSSGESDRLLAAGPPAHAK